MSPRLAAPLLAVLTLLVAAEPALAADDEPWNIRARRTTVIRGDGDERIVSFIDGVVIHHGDLVATSDRARYLETTRTVILTGNVVMTQDSTIVRGPVGTYARDTGTGRFPSGVLIERDTGTAVADAGVWHRSDNRFELRGRAAAADTSGTLDADEMTYDMSRERFWAVGSARFVDDASGVVVTGERLEYDRRANFSRATGSPEAFFRDDDEVPVRVTADFLDYDPAADVVQANGAVRILRETLEALADSAVLYRDVDRTVLTGSPVLVDGVTEISGDRIDMTVDGPGKRTIRVTGAASVANRFLQDADRPGPIDAEAAGPVPADAESIELFESPVPEGTDAPRDSVESRGEEIRTAEADPALVDSLVVSPEPAGDEEGPEETPKTIVTEALGAAGAAADSTEAGDGSEQEEGEPTPEWLTIPGPELPEANLLFGDEILMFFEDGELDRVVVVGHSRSKFYPNEEEGDLTEWNDVLGDTLHVWFTESSVDSVTVFGNGSGEYRLPAPEDRRLPDERLLEVGRLVRYRAPEIRYDRGEEKMYLSGGAEVDYKTMKLTSGKIDFEAAKEVMVASGDPSPVLVDREDEIYGSEMLYHLPTRKGEIRGGRTQFENGYYQGKDIWKVDEDVMAVEEGVYTTCDLEAPHYHFASRQMKIYLDDKVVAKPVVLKIRNIPVFALPFYVASLRKDRHSGFLLPNLELGVDDNRGRFIRNVGYYWAPNDYLDLTTTFDFYPGQERFVSYLTSRYRVRYEYDGQVKLKYNRDTGANRRDTVVEARHHQIFSDTAELTANGSFLSSSTIFRDIDDARRLDRDIRSHATFTKRFPGSNRSFRAEVERRENLDTGAINETLPVVQFSQPSRPITGQRQRALPGEVPETSWLDEIYYSLDSRLVNERTRDNDGDEERHTGSRVDVSLRSTGDIGPFLRISPSLRSEGMWQDEDRQGNSTVFRGTFNTSVGATSTVYGTLLRPVGPLRGLRHVFEPNVSWNWSPEFDRYFFTDESGVRQDRFFSFGGLGATQRKTNRASLSVRNLVQTKLKRGETERRYDLFTMRSSINYDFLAIDDGRKPLSNLTSSLNVLSSAPVNQTWSATHDPYTWDLLSSSVTTRAALSSSMFRRSRSSAPSEPLPLDDGAQPPGFEPSAENPVGGGRPSSSRNQHAAGTWQFDVSHSFQRGRTSDDISSRLVLNTYFVPTPKWSIRFNSQYDLETGENTSQSWSVHRFVHCWELSFDRRLLGGEWQYFIRVNVLDLPDIKAERGDAFRGRTSAGGLPGLPGF